MKRLIVSLLFTFIALGLLRAQTPGGTPFRIEKLDPSLDEIVAPDARLETLGDRFALTEGPVWVPEGPNVAFGDADNRSLYITACTHLFKIRLKIAGVRPGQLP